MKRYCIPLELIAFAIHPGDTQSTTTVCLDAAGRALYVTSQSNARFEDVDREKIHRILDALSGLAHQTDVKNAKTDFWVNQCALYSKEVTNKKGQEKIDKIFSDGAYHKLFQRFLDGKYRPAELNWIKDHIWQVSVINNDDIFSGHTPDTTGFHGESRLIRFFFIREYPGVHLQKTQTFFYSLPGQALPGQTKMNAYEWFKERISAQALAMGSSQGTCKKCAACLDDYKIDHGIPENEPAQWLDPLTMCGNQGSTVITKSDSHHAIYPAFSYLVRPD